MRLLHRPKIYFCETYSTSSYARTIRLCRQRIPLNSNNLQEHSMSFVKGWNKTSCILSALLSFHIKASLTKYVVLIPSNATFFTLQFILHLKSFCTSPNFAWVYFSWNCLSINDWDPQGMVVLRELKSASYSFSALERRTLSYWTTNCWSVVVELMNPSKKSIHPSLLCAVDMPT